VLLFNDATRLRLFPPWRSVWAQTGKQALVPVTGRNAKRVLFGAINVRTSHRIVIQRPGEGASDVQALFEAVRRCYRHAPTIWLLLEEASPIPQQAPKNERHSCLCNWSGCRNSGPSGMPGTSYGAS
jgi:hypothetical protein